MMELRKENLEGGKLRASPDEVCSTPFSIATKSGNCTLHLIFRD
jgi:hypothetical protein